MTVKPKKEIKPQTAKPGEEKQKPKVSFIKPAGQPKPVNVTPKKPKEVVYEGEIS